MKFSKKLTKDNYTEIALEMAKDTKELKENLDKEEYVELKNKVETLQKEGEDYVLNLPTAEIDNEDLPKEKEIITNAHMYIPGKSTTFLVGMDYGAPMEIIGGQIEKFAKEQGIDSSSLRFQANDRSQLHKREYSAQVSEVGRTSEFVEKVIETPVKQAVYTEQIRDEHIDDQEEIEEEQDLDVWGNSPWEHQRV